MIDAPDPDSIYSRRKAITAFFPYAAREEQNGQFETLDTFLRTARASREQGFMWHCVKPFVTSLLTEESPVSLKRVAILASPHLTWRNFTYDKHTIQLWGAAASTVPYTHDIGQSVVGTLLLIKSLDSLRPHIPVGVWSWLNKRPSLPPICAGRSLGTELSSVQTVRKLGDIEILTSYLLLVWSEWDGILSGFEEMCTSIKEDFGVVGMGYHRRELLQRLNHVLGQLDYLRQYRPNLHGTHIWWVEAQYEKLREILLEVDGEVVDKLIRESPRPAILFATNSDIPRTGTGCRSTFMCATPLPSL